MSQELLSLQLSITETGADDERLDELTIMLMNQLREIDTQSIDRPSGEDTPVGAKGDPLTVGVLILTILSSSIPPLISLIQSMTGEGRKVKIKSGDIEIEFTPQKRLSQDEILTIVTKLQQSKPKKN